MHQHINIMIHDHGPVITMLLVKLNILPRFTFLNKNKITIALCFNKHIKMKTHPGPNGVMRELLN